MRKPLILVRRLVVAAALTLLVACATVPGEGTPSTPVPADAETLLAQGDAALARGELPEAARAYRLAADASDDEAVAEQATRVAFDNFQFGEASRAADRWLALNPSSEQAERYAGVSALALHRLDEAEEHFARLIESAYISTAAGFLALLPVMMDEGNPPDVTELFRRLAARHPTLAEGQVALGTAALRSDNYALAMQSAQRAVELAPYWVPAKLLLARTQIASGQEDLGLATARELVMAPGLGRRDAHRVRAAARRHGPGRGGARGADAVRVRPGRGARRRAQPGPDGPPAAAISRRPRPASRTCSRRGRSPTSRFITSASSRSVATTPSAR